ncbi:glycosyltransferase family 4 protein [Acidaminobacter hydrogenoformans]|uniref:Glycosyltransferase involved in cell wall bisynthesis n=1 Tax=Acidaminobacter hydrogenoformans DSM 2784 TaxID=1120920 RepID=A0A1G5RPM6_9FIRM|nr:glycosyltransferase family 4 protein [Acidaminobacter hydrogenoformans]SCZ76085.1 Glycosyltransferase involved in cell wall bisynthesis [Acidaminobacter hydrogenoformans DSM 2784]
MNILLISPLPPPPGGIASWTEGYLNSHRASEHQIHVVNEAVIGARIKNFNQLHYFEELKRTRHILLDLKKALKANRIELVHLNSACGRLGLIRDYFCAKAIRHERIRLVTHFHCNIPHWIKGGWRLFLFRRLVSFSDVVLTLNTESKQFVLEHCGKTSINLPNFVSEEVFNRTTNVKEIPDSINKILYVGHVEEAKGSDVIYQVAKLFPGIQFSLLGFVDEAFKKMDRPDNLYLIGEVSKEQVISEMLAADLFIFPSHTEGFPIVVLEAMACGLPIVSTPVGAVPDMIEKSGGVLIPVNDAAAAAEAIRFLQNKSTRIEMSLWNKQKVQQTYGIDLIMDRLFELYGKGSRGASDEKSDLVYSDTDNRRR